MKTHVTLLCCSLLFQSLHLHSAIGQERKSTVPDFTRGETIPRSATHDWNLGATGARGWMFADKLVMSSARQIRITEVQPQSPAAEELAVGDVILGVAGTMFAS
ncbi:MAG: PDZ domain-containing protein, partial [Planctomycetes bacterium]|nr:PDZ domain-containing protein [Planctomycetota bacterium]